MKKLLILLLGINLIACSGNREKVSTELEKLDWLIGDWKRTNDEAGKLTFENWKKISEKEYEGIGFTLQAGDTISQEQMNIVATNGKWQLFVRMPQEPEATVFEITEVTQNAFTCVHPANNFPNKIHYVFVDEKIKATISNEEMVILFDFEKVK